MDAKGTNQMRTLGLFLFALTACSGSGLTIQPMPDGSLVDMDMAVTMTADDLATADQSDMTGLVVDLAQPVIRDMTLPPPDMALTCSCPPMDSCHANVCAGSTCTHPAFGDGTTCNDGTPGTCYSASCCSGCWDGTTCQTGTQPAACGASGGACASCDDSNPCTIDQCNSTSGACMNVASPSYSICGSNMQCIGTVCTDCGSLSQACCGGPGGTCGSGTMCLSGTCVSSTCGNLGQQCCPVGGSGTMCNGTLLCAPGQNLCWECGKKNHGCCGGVGGTCDPNLVCNQGNCECGGNGEPCCGGTGGTCGAGLHCSLNTCI